MFNLFIPFLLLSVYQIVLALFYIACLYRTNLNNGIFLSFENIQKELHDMACFSFFAGLIYNLVYFICYCFFTHEYLYQIVSFCLGIFLSVPLKVEITTEEIVTTSEIIYFILFLHYVSF